MGMRPVGPKWIRRLSRNVGVPVSWANGNGGYLLWFATFDHRHGVYDMKSGEFAIRDRETYFNGHWSSCFTDHWSPLLRCYAEEANRLAAIERSRRLGGVGP